MSFNIKTVSNVSEVDLENFYCTFFIYLNKEFFEDADLKYVDRSLREALNELISRDFIKHRRDFRSKKNMVFVIYFGEYDEELRSKFYNLEPSTKAQFWNLIWGSPVYDDKQLFKEDYYDLIKGKNYLDSFFVHCLIYYFRCDEWDELNTAHWRKKHAQQQNL